MSKKSVSCPVETTLAVIGGLWKVLILRELLGGTKRFNELHRALAGVTHRTLTQQLRELEAHRVIRRKVYRQVPPKVEYSLTPLGETLKPVLDAMHQWGEKYPHGLTGKKGQQSLQPVRAASLP
jgi:DNA-binding HxlR family transcriptional regulator